MIGHSTPVYSSPHPYPKLTVAEGMTSRHDSTLQTLKHLQCLFVIPSSNFGAVMSDQVIKQRAQDNSRRMK